MSREEEGRCDKLAILLPQNSLHLTPPRFIKFEQNVAARDRELDLTFPLPSLFASSHTHTHLQRPKQLLLYNLLLHVKIQPGKACCLNLSYSEESSFLRENSSFSKPKEATFLVGKNLNLRALKVDQILKKVSGLKEKNRIAKN